MHLENGLEWPWGGHNQGGHDGAEYDWRRLGGPREGFDMQTLTTWAGRSKFTYTGSVAYGLMITYGKGFSVTISTAEYKALLKQFHGRTVEIGTSRTNPPCGSVGEWLMNNVTKTGIVSYIGPILINAGYAVKVGKTQIKFI
jgi:hypothetical protein